MSSSNGQVLHQTETIWKFLDNLSLKNPKEYRQFIDSILIDGAKNNLGPPAAQFAVETVKLPEVIPKCKYYLNFAAWSQLPKPESETSPIAITTSDIRKEIVEKEWGFVLDVALNPTVFSSNDDSNQTAKCFLIELVFRHVESKFSLKLSRKHTILDEEKYVGNKDNLLNFMCPTALKSTLSDAVNGIDKNLNFDEIKRICQNGVNTDEDEHKLSTNKQNKTCNNQMSDINCNKSSNELEELKTTSYNNNSVQTNKHKTILQRPKVEMTINKQTSRVEITIFLPLVESVQECDLDLAENSLSLHVPEKYELELPLPVTIDIDDAKAKFVKDERTLLVDALSLQ